MRQQLLARYRVRRVQETLAGDRVRWWEIFVLTEEVVIWGPAPRELGRDRFVERAVDVALQWPVREVILHDDVYALWTVLNARQQHAVESRLHEIAAVASLPEAADSDSVHGDRLQFGIPGSQFELHVQREEEVAPGDPEKVSVRIADLREAKVRNRDLAAPLRRRRIHVGAAERAIRALPDEAQDAVWEWLELVTNRRATPAQLGLPEDAHPSLRAVKDLDQAHGAAVAGIAQRGVQQAVVYRSGNRFRLRIGTSTKSTPFWKLVVNDLEQNSFKPGPPGAGHYSPDFKTRTLRRLGILMIVGWQSAAGLQEASNSGEIPGLTHRLGIGVLELALAALFIPIGQAISGWSAKRLLARGVGTRPLVMAAAVGYVGLLLAGLAHPGRFALLIVIASWFLFGLSNGYVDVPIGLLADRLNQGSGRGQFAALGMFSFTVASIIGAGVSAISLARHVPMVSHLAVVWGVGIVITLVTLAGPNLHKEPDVADILPKEGDGGRRIALVVVVSAAALGPLGAVYAWGPRTLVDLGAAPAVAALATFGFTVAGGLIQLAAFLAQRNRPRAVVIAGAVASFSGTAAIAFAAFDTTMAEPVRVGAALFAFLVVGAGVQLAPALLPETAGKLARKFKRSPSQVQANLTLANYIALGIGQAVQGGIATLVALGPASVKAVAVPLAAALLFAMSGTVMAVGAPFIPKR